MPINLSKSDLFCPAPWVNLHISTDGEFKPCCGGNGSFGSVHDEKWEYITTNNAKLNTLKKDLLSNTENSYCNKNCLERNWYKEFLNKDIIIKDETDFQLKSIDVRWGNTCQLSCTYCGPHNSSSWGNIISKFKNEPPESSRNYKTKLNDLMDFFEKNKESIIRINLVGGEPLLLKENVELLDVIPSNARVEIITNLGVDLRSNNIYKKLLSKQVSWHVSMETVGQRFEFVRRGASWETQVANLHLLENDVKGSKSNINFHGLYHVYSALNLVEMFEFANQFENIGLDWFPLLYRPLELNFFNYPRRLKDMAIKEIDTCVEKFPHRTNSISQLQQFKDQLQSGTEDPDVVQKCIEFHRMQGLRFFNSQPDFLDLWPQYNLG